MCSVAVARGGQGVHDGDGGIVDGGPDLVHRHVPLRSHLGREDGRLDHRDVRLERQTLGLPGSEAAVEELGVLVAVVPQRPPQPGAPQPALGVVDDHGRVVPDALFAHQLRERLGVHDVGGAAELVEDVEATAPGMWPWA